MRSTSRVPPWLAALAVLAMFLAGTRCLASGPRVLATIFPLYDMAKGVAGGRAQVSLLLPPGANPHSWEPRPSDMLRIRDADVVIMVGAGLEPWAQELIRQKQNGHPLVLEASEGAPLIHLRAHAHEGERHARGVDPHVWLDFSWDKVLVDRICAALSDLDPGGRETYERGRDAYKERLDRLISAYREGLSGCASRKLVVGGHGAFNYLARSYGLEQVSLYGLSPDARPTPRRLAEVVELVEKEGIRGIFFEETVSDRLARVIAEETGARILTLSPGASLTQEQIRSGIGFVELMYNNLKHLQEGLGCR